MRTTKYSYAPSRFASRRGVVAHLLPAYDEYTVAYGDRSAFLDPAHVARTRNGIFSPVVLVDERIVGTWRRGLIRNGVAVTVELLCRVGRPAIRALEGAAEDYGNFLGRPASIQVRGR